jgi:4-hydroxy-4-methyl-2-oxoglutarate aldolase
MNQIGSSETNSSEISQDILAQVRVIASATLHEAAGQSGAMDADIRPVVPGLALGGTALTVRCQPGDNLTLHAAIALARPGEVIVADVGDYTEAGHWGEILTVAAQARQVAGLVINGGVRDVEAAQHRHFPVFSRSVSMKATVKRTFGQINVPIVCAGVPVWPGDLVVGDQDGVVVIPARKIAPTLRAANEREEHEVQVMSRLEKGELTLDILGFREILEANGIELDRGELKAQ